jgi:hypothetical protein
VQPLSEPQLCSFESARVVAIARPVRALSSHAQRVLCADMDYLYISGFGARELWLTMSCPAGGARLPNGGCGTCSDFAYRHPQSDVCIECPVHTSANAQGTCSDCPAGQERLVGSNQCTACQVGKHQPQVGSTCAVCLPGKYAMTTGSIMCFDCAMGSFAAAAGAATCQQCGIGKFSSTPGASLCSSCPVGGFCASVGAASASMTFEQCASGTFNPSLGASNSSSCLRCPVGKASPVPGSSQSTVCADCLPGSVAPNTGTAVCERCASGTFQATRGQTACRNCTAGYLCVEGSSAPQPCPGGRHADQSVLASVGFLSDLDTDCIVCPAGTSCSVGSNEPSPCLPGSITNVTEKQTCDLCERGKFQRHYGQTVCDDCVAGFYCRSGAAEPRPCPAGTTGNATGLWSVGLCVPVPPGSWAPLGSAVPETDGCGTGFYCPGALQDDAFFGAKPIIMPVGGSVSERTASEAAPEQLLRDAAACD